MQNPARYGHPKAPTRLCVGFIRTGGKCGARGGGEGGKHRTDEEWTSSLFSVPRGLGERERERERARERCRHHENGGPPTHLAVRPVRSHWRVAAGEERGARARTGRRRGLGWAGLGSPGAGDLAVSEIDCVSGVADKARGGRGGEGKKESQRWRWGPSANTQPFFGTCTNQTVERRRRRPANGRFSSAAPAAQARHAGPVN